MHLRTYYFVHSFNNKKIEILSLWRRKGRRCLDNKVSKSMIKDPLIIHLAIAIKMITPILAFGTLTDATVNRQFTS